MKSFSTPPTFSPPPYSSQSTRPSRLPPLFHTLFLALSALAFIFALAIVACAAASIRAYHHSDLPPSWYLPLWPSQLDLRPTRALLAVGVIVAVVCLANLVVGLVPGLNRSTLRTTPLATATTALSLFLTIFALSLSRALNHAQGDALAGSLQSWTCNFRSFAAIAPLGFVDICRQSHAAVDLTAVLLVLEVLALACAGLGCCVEVRKGRAGRAGEETKLDEFS